MRGPLPRVAARRVAALLERAQHNPLRGLRGVGRIVHEPRLDAPPLLEIALARRLGERPDLELLVLALDRGESPLRVAAARVGHRSVVLRPEPVAQVCATARAPAPHAHHDDDRGDDHGRDDDPFPGLHSAPPSLTSEEFPAPLRRKPSFCSVRPGADLLQPNERTNRGQ